MNVGIIMAAGRSDRMGAKVDRAFLSLGSKPVLAYSLEAFESCADIDSVVVVAKRDRLAAVKNVAQMFGCTKVAEIIAGSPQRRDSLQCSLDLLDGDTRFVTIHDCSRPCVTGDLVSETLKAAKRYGSGVAAYRIPDSVKLVERGQKVTKTMARGQLWLTQTPQSFRVDTLRRALSALPKGCDPSDASEILEEAGVQVHLVPAPLANLKVATTDDLAMVTSLL